MAEHDEVRADAEALIAAHLGDAWSFAFDRARKRAGACDFRARRITLSRLITAAATREQMRQTVLHEIAHALAGHAAGHGPAWLREARRIGYRGGRTHDLPIPAQLANWIGTCPAGHEIPRFRAPGPRPRSCGQCSRRFDERHLITWRRRERTG